MTTLPLRALFAFIMLSLPCWVAAQSPFDTRGKGLPIVNSSVLPVDEAFALSTFIEAPDTVVVLWDIRQGYYLYRKSLVVMDANGKTVAVGALPASVMLTDEYFGNVEVYYDKLILRFPLSLLSRDGHTYPLTLLYQGCAQDKYCYPPQERNTTLILPE